MGIAADLFFNTSAPEECLDWRIRPSDEQYEAQRERWNALAEHLLEDLRNRSGYVMSSWLQGSYKFGTQVRPAHRDQEFDIDLGVYFRWPGSPDDGRWGPDQLKDIVQESLEEYVADQSNDAVGASEPKTRCNRIHFEEQFHIDVPSYHLDADRDARSLATQDRSWEDSDPKAIYEWWKEAIEEAARPRVRRLVRYLKMWAALRFAEDGRPSSILLTVLAAEAYLSLEPGELTGDDEFLRAVAAAIVGRLKRSSVVANPANNNENLNRLSSEHSDEFIEKLETLRSAAERALVAPTNGLSAEVWSEMFDHFFPVPDEDASIYESLSKAIIPIRFDPQVAVRATTRGNPQRTYQGVNEIGPIPKSCDIYFVLTNANSLPAGALVTWTVRNHGKEAESENDLGHVVGLGREAKEESAYRGRHFMDVTARLNGLVIGRRKVPVIVTGLGLPPRNPPKPSYTSFRTRRR